MPIRTMPNRVIKAYQIHYSKKMPDELELDSEDDIARLFTSEIQKGDGMVGRLMMKLNNSVFKNRPNYRPTPDPTGTKYAGTFEMHYPGHNFTGPGTFYELRVARGDLATDSVDAASQLHDKAYSEISNKIIAGELRDKDEIARLVRQADQEMLRKLEHDRIFKETPMLRNFIIHKIIASKSWLEKMGLLDPGKFVGYKPIEEEEVVEDEEQEGGAFEEIKEVMAPVSKSLNAQAKEPTYECCKSCHNNLGVCEKLPGWKLKLKMMEKI